MPSPFASPTAEVEIDKSMWPQVLIVDDDQSILKLVGTVLTAKGIAPTVAGTIAEAQKKLQENPDFCLVLCDHLLPDGAGLDLLRTIRVHYSLIVRILMTGAYDRGLAMDAINDGDVYRSIAKPFTIEDLMALITQAFDRYKLAHDNAHLRSELRLREEELRRIAEETERKAKEEADRLVIRREENKSWRAASEGMIGLCHELIHRIDPDLFRHSRRVATVATAIARELKTSADTLSKVEIAAHLHDIALIGAAAEVRAAQRDPDRIADLQVRDHLKEHAAVAADLVAFLPARDVVDAIRQHHEYLDGSGYPEGLAGERISTLAQILSVADCFEEWGANAGKSDREILPRMQAEAGVLFAPEILHALDRAVTTGIPLVRERQVLPHELIPGMKLTSSIYTAAGMLLVKQGQVLTLPIIQRLLQYAEANANLTQHIYVEA